MAAGLRAVHSGGCSPPAEERLRKWIPRAEVRNYNSQSAPLAAAAILMRGRWGEGMGGEEMATGGGSSGSECGALRVSGSGRSRSRSYGSTARSPGSPARGPHLEHRLRPGDTLQGLALRYGTEQIKRSNRLYTNDSIFLKPSLRIPAVGTGDSGGETPPVGIAPEGEGEPRPELSPADFLQHLDARISRCKAAALSKVDPRGERIEALPPPRCGPVLGPAPLSRTTRSTDLRDVEDLIFDL